MGSSMPQVRTGKAQASGAAKKVVLGFRPKKVDIFIVSTLARYEKTDQMVTKFAVKQITNGTITFPDDMITITSDGFQMEATLASSGVEITYTAWESKAE